ncbi:hypothetical protein [Gordonia paraffinivorans]|uniref:hypothetical protein n=1 Tax=Gordonia paraffinivorans TaxID=175628 RepID=UPI00242FCB67|nr:hypothetical protein [Gordonia paraffinivorans]
MSAGEVSPAASGGGQVTARAGALACVLMGFIVIAASFMHWVHAGHGIDANGFGFVNRRYAELTGLQLTLGWFTTALGLLIIVGGLAALYAVVRQGSSPRPGFTLVTGAGVAAVVIAGAIPVRPVGLTLPLGSLGATSAAGDLGEPVVGIFVLLAAALTSVVIGLVGVSLGARDAVAQRWLAVAIAAGAVVGVLAVALVWWWLGRGALDVGVLVPA